MHDANIEHSFKIWTQTTYDWNLMKRIQVIIKTRNTHDWATRLIKKSEKKMGKVQIMKLRKTWDLNYVTLKVS